METIIFVGMIVFIIYAYYPSLKSRKCPSCLIKMTSDVDNNNQIIFACPNCKKIEETSVYFGG